MRDLQRLGASVALEPGTTGSRVAGAGLQLLNGGVLAQGYLEAMRRTRWVGRGWRAGLILGLAHGVLAGGLLGVTPALHPRVPEDLPPPGWFLSRRGTSGAVMLVALHVLFGVVVVSAITPRRVP